MTFSCEEDEILDYEELIDEVETNDETEETDGQVEDGSDDGRNDETMNATSKKADLEALKIKVDQTSGKNLVSSQTGVHKRYIFIGNVEFSTTVNELKLHFKACCPIARATVFSDKFTVNLKGQLHTSQHPAAVPQYSFHAKRHSPQAPQHSSYLPGSTRGRG
ncbi:hypothetical protein HELRODRAFT_159028 [Helobdella robusta]|uniref:RRM domain-containing protein n=1 Tax=Helobdella robusta TaxID=6412 RepID=T1ENI0_HELRO|nr:hypothetical protein HELRODRAFT_159028 [Helobdella robusta]ESO12486.1 hypothetical protein HELRODRAFT_159028 [Helobdella robusta]